MTRSLTKTERAVVDDSRAGSDNGGDPVRLAMLGSMALVALQLARFANPAHAVDDAWISFRVARSALDTGVLTYDTTQPPVEGMTNLLWTVLAMSWVHLPVDPIVPARVLGALCHLATVGILVGLSARVVRTAGGNPVVAAGVTGLLLASSGSMAFYALSGLETPLYGLWYAAAAAALCAGNPKTVGVLLGLAAATRPEGVLAGGMVIAALAASGGRARIGVVAAVALPFAAIVAGMEAFRLYTYGALVPNTYYAKPPDVEQGLAYVGAGLLWGTGGLGLLGALPAARRFVAARYVLAGIGVLALGVVWSGGDWMPGERRLVELLLAGATLAGISAGTARARVWVAAAAASWVLANLGAAIVGQDGDEYEHAYLAQLGVAATETPGVQTVALSDIGRFGWAFPGSVLDLSGLVDRHIAHQSGRRSEKAWDEDYFRERAPDLVLVRCASPITDPLRVMPKLALGEVPVVTSMLSNGGYRYHGQMSLSEGHSMLIFGREGLDLDPALWGPAFPRNLRDVLSEAAR